MGLFENDDGHQRRETKARASQERRVDRAPSPGGRKMDLAGFDIDAPGHAIASA
jgi:hypothetical protein